MALYEKKSTTNFSLRNIAIKIMLISIKEFHKKSQVNLSLRVITYIKNLCTVITNLQKFRTYSLIFFKLFSCHGRSIKPKASPYRPEVTQLLLTQEAGCKPALT